MDSISNQIVTCLTVLLMAYRDFRNLMNTIRLNRAAILGEKQQATPLPVHHFKMPTNGSIMPGERTNQAMLPVRSRSVNPNFGSCTNPQTGCYPYLKLTFSLSSALKPGDSRWYTVPTWYTAL